MNIESMFLQKAIEDKNYVSFMAKGKNYKKVRPVNLKNDILKTDCGDFVFKDIKKLIVLKERY